MEEMLLIRETLISYFKRYENIIMAIIKFITGLIIFSLIGGIDYALPVFDKITSSGMTVPYIILMSVLFSVAPIPFGYALMILNLGINLSAAIEVAIVLVGFLLIALLLYARLAPKESILILATLAAYYFKLPYLIPIVAGMYFSMTSIIPVSIGVFMWRQVPFIQGMLKASESETLSLTELPKSMYSQLLAALTTNYDWVVISFIFGMIILVVYIVSRLSIDYSKDIAIGIAGALTLISFTIAILIVEIDVGLLGVFLSTVFCVAIAEVIRFFDVVADYDRVENVTFSDEDNIYYVKIVPKSIVSKRKETVIAEEQPVKPAVRESRETENYVSSYRSFMAQIEESNKEKQ